eukprot:scaffold82933_cov19-Prasinocladus_malaysianus.AAC.1
MVEGKWIHYIGVHPIIFALCPPRLHLGPVANRLCVSSLRLIWGKLLNGREVLQLGQPHIMPLLLITLAV